MPKSDDVNKKPPKQNIPLAPTQDDVASQAELEATQLRIGDTRKTASQHTTRMPAPVMTKPKKKKKENGC